MLIDHLNLTVRDFGESADWYRRVFGFEVVEDKRDASGARWGVLRCGDALLCIYEHPELRMEDEPEGIHRVNHFGLRISDRAAWEATMGREGVVAGYGGAVRWPHSTAWYVTDPTGWEIEVALWDGNRVAFG